MKTVGKVALIVLMAFLFMGCSMNGQLRSSHDTQWSGHYHAMYDRVQQTHPEMDLVLNFCEEMIRFSDQYEQNVMSRDEFFAKQCEMRTLLQKALYHRQISGQEKTGAGPFEEHLVSKR